MVAKYNAQLASATKKIPLELLTGMTPRPSWQEADEVEEMGSSSEEEAEPAGELKTGQAAPMDSTTRRQLASKRCPELERIGLASWKHECPVSALLEAADITVECKGVDGPTAFRKIKPAKVQQ